MCVCVCDFKFFKTYFYLCVCFRVCEYGNMSMSGVHRGQGRASDYLGLGVSGGSLLPHGWGTDPMSSVAPASDPNHRSLSIPCSMFFLGSQLQCGTNLPVNYRRHPVEIRAEVHGPASSQLVFPNHLGPRTHKARFPQLGQPVFKQLL